MIHSFLLFMLSSFFREKKSRKRSRRKVRRRKWGDRMVMEWKNRTRIYMQLIRALSDKPEARFKVFTVVTESYEEWTYGQLTLFFYFPGRCNLEEKYKSYYIKKLSVSHESRYCICMSIFKRINPRSKG